MSNPSGNLKKRLEEVQDMLMKKIKNIDNQLNRDYYQKEYDRMMSELSGKTEDITGYDLKFEKMSKLLSAINGIKK
ncbi:hypothetical protein [Bacillus sp. 196mf]|uniref:hypothetical protein n=1 Tax=Bacillus sp. 196mf TaxID=1761754 RepID=UPI000D7BD3C3|nr:hypothetical protein [Bacillus sp. 196mf]